MHYIFILCGFFLICPGYVESLFVIKKLACKCYDPSFCEFEKCEMKIVRRGVTEVNSICNYYQLPIDDIKLHIQLFKQSNGYRPFLFNQTVDYCSYMRNINSQPLFHAFYKTWITTTNFNHSCPFNHAIIVKNLEYNGNHIMNNLPMPNGEYMVAMKTFTSPSWRSEYKVYVTKTD